MLSLPNEHRDRHYVVAFHQFDEIGDVALYHHDNDNDDNGTIHHDNDNDNN